jgi:menaquinone-dependent protoporphyrinogen oxidase
MAKVLIVFNTIEGQTGKIARQIGTELRNLGHAVDEFNTSGKEESPLISTYDGFVVGAPVHVSGYPSNLRKWVKFNAKDLSAQPGAFFSVCLGILQTNDVSAQKAERNIVTEFFEWSSWRPALWAIFAGALPYSKYGVIKRFVMKRISARAGGDTDTSRDYEYTNWDDVRRFANEFSAEINSRRQGGALLRRVENVLTT